MLGDWFYWLIGGLLGAAGAILALWSLFADRARGRRRCPKCWYDMSGAEGDPPHTCPECGNVIKRTRKLHKTRRRWRWAILSILILIASAISFDIPRVRRNGLAESLPTTVLILAIGWADDDWPIEALAPRLWTEVCEHIPLPDVSTLKPWQQRLLRGSCLRAAESSSSLELRRSALLLLAFCPHSPDLSARICALVDDPEDEIRRSAASTASLRCGFFPEEQSDHDLLAYVPTFAKLLDDPDLELRRSAAGGLMVLGPASAPAVPALIEAVNDEDDEVRERAMLALGEIGPPAASSVPVLIESLHRGDQDTRCLAVSVLGDVGQSDAAALSALLTCLETDSDPIVRSFSAWALSGSKPADPAVLEALIAAVEQDPNERVRRSAIKAVGQLGSDSAEVMSVLQFCLDSDDSDTRKAAADAIEAIEQSIAPVD